MGSSDNEFHGYRCRSRWSEGMGEEMECEGVGGGGVRVWVEVE